MDVMMCVELEPVSLSQKHCALEAIASDVHSALRSYVAP